MTLAELRTVTDRLIRQRDDVTDAIINDAINDAYRRICAGRVLVGVPPRSVSLRFNELESTGDVTLVDGTFSYDFPTDAQTIDHIDYEYDSTNDRHRALREVSYARFSTLDQTRDQEPSFYAIHNNKILVTPRPGSDQAGDILKVWFYKGSNVTALTAGNSPVIPVHYHSSIAYMAARDLLNEYGEPEIASTISEHLLRRFSELQTPEAMRHTSAKSAFNRRITR